MMRKKKTPIKAEPAGKKSEDAPRPQQTEAKAPEPVPAWVSGRFGKASRLWLLLPVAAAILVYARVLAGGYVWDDFILQEQIVAKFRSALDAFFPPAELMTSNYYRPVVLLSFYIEHLIFGSDSKVAMPAFMHVVNVLSHAGVTALVYLLTEDLMDDSPWAGLGACLAALWFALHPIHTEPVGWISGRTDLFATLFMLAALYAAARFVERGGRALAVLSGVLLLVGLFSKENAVAFVVVGPVFLYALLRLRKLPMPSRGDLMWLAGATAAACVVYLVLRVQNSPFAPYGAPTQPVTVLNVLRVVAFYILRCFVPWPQSPYVMLANLPSTPMAIAVLVVSAAALAAIFFAPWRAKWVFAAAAALTLIPMGPGLIYILRPAGTIVAAERIIYMSTAGVAIALAYGATRALEAGWLRKPFYALSTLVLASFLVGTVMQSVVWSDDLVFWVENSKRPELYRDRGANMFIAESYLVAGQAEEAEKWYRHMMAPEVTGPGHLIQGVYENLARAMLITARSKFDMGLYADASIKASEALRILDRLSEKTNERVALMVVAQEIIMKSKMNVSPGR